MPVLTCPKCESPMRSYERSGITIDQCTSCRGVFLDRGELERLVDAEGSFYEQAPRPEPVAPPAPRPQPYVEHQGPYVEHQQSYGGHHPSHHGKHGKHGHRKRRGFLEDMFDFG